MKGKINLLLISVTFGLLALTSCDKQRSNSTGWEYNDPDNGGFEYVDYYGQETGPGLVLVEGGTFSMGRVEQDVMYDWNNIPRRVSVSSFYMDQTEVRNVDYREYLYWLSRVYLDYPEVYQMALPDTLVWRNKLAFNEPYVELYLRHPAYQEYPVVGVSWTQADKYCEWRTDRVNEWILIREGLFEKDPNQQADNNFNTDAYLAGQYEGVVKSEGLVDIAPERDYRKVRMEDGIFLPRYRLPTEAEWEYAALSLVGNHTEERIYARKFYPWNGHHIRNEESKNLGMIMANGMRGRGDMMGIAHSLNDNADITAPVDAYWPNDYDLYCMAGNVNEWVMDVYRPMTSEVMEDFRPFRGNVYKTQVRDDEGFIVDKDSLGKLEWREVTDEEAFNRRNYNQSDNINFLDGDVESSVITGSDWNAPDDAILTQGSSRMYNQGRAQNNVRGGMGMTSMVTDRTRVYKGGSWKDRAYWLAPGARRYLDENESTADIGFRCAMTRVGSPMGF